MSAEYKDDRTQAATDDPTIRAATPADVEVLSRVAHAAYAKYVTRIGRAPAPMVADFSNLVTAGEVEVILAGGQVAGFIVLRPGSEHLFIENVAVDPARQGAGLGRRLLAHAEGRARGLGLPALRLYTNVKMTENFPFYEGLGFVETERHHEDGFDRVYMEKGLG